MKNAFIKAFPKSLPVLFGYVTLGIGFGLLLDSAGYDSLWAFLMSVFIFSGSAQYVAVDIMNYGTVLEAALLILVVNFRHAFYGLAVLERYEDAGWRKPYLVHALTDETFAIAVTYDESEDDVKPVDFYFALSLLNQCYWITGSLIGTLIPKLVSVNTKGVDFSMTSLFIVLLIDQLKKKENIVPAIIGAAVSLVCLLMFGPRGFLIPSLMIISCLLLCFKKKLDKGVRTDE